jgi:alpha-beta hydrolase superfamily lysophospholipase
MKRWVWTSTRYALKFLGTGIFGGLVVLIIVFVMVLENRPDLNIWHEAELEAEYTATSPAGNFQDYLAIEERLFKQLADRVYAQIAPEDQNPINRFHRGSLSDPARWSPNWNRTFEFTAPEPRIGVLLLHGLSDSPYSLRSLGLRLHEAGAWVVGLRLPGHGTAPSGLVTVRWQDMAAAAKLALRHLQAQVGNRPLYIVGYSTGGALAVHYALDALEDPSLPRIERLVLISGAIGVTPFAVLAVWQARLGHLLGLDKLAWNDILPEYDPFKYNSFPVNAGDQVYRLSKDIQSRLFSMKASGALKPFPSVLAFQSVVDATVSIKALIEGLFAHLPEEGGHELLLFDIRRTTDIESLLISDPKTMIESYLQTTGLPFTLSVVKNVRVDSDDLALYQKRPSSSKIIEKSLPYEWPEEIYSLAHVALPFAPEDPVYGGPVAAPGPGIHLGNLAMRGERGVLQISPAAIMRLRHNPFYPFLEQRVLDFMQLPP